MKSLIKISCWFLFLLNILVISHGQRQRPFVHCEKPGLVAITFDDGPHPIQTNQVLDVLKEFNLTVTFFVNGLYNYEPDEKGYREKVTRAFNEGHQIGSHSSNHKNLSALTKEEVRKELGTLAKLVEGIIGRNLTVFRPPFGEFNDQLLEIAQDEFGYDVINWNVDTGDWSHPGDLDAGLQNWKNAIEAADSNSSFIGLHHDVHLGAADLARRTIEYVQSQNFTIVTIAECIGGEMYQKPNGNGGSENKVGKVKGHQLIVIGFVLILSLVSSSVSGLYD